MDTKPPLIRTGSMVDVPVGSFVKLQENCIPVICPESESVGVVVSSSKVRIEASGQDIWLVNVQPPAPAPTALSSTSIEQALQLGVSVNLRITRGDS